MSQSLQPKTRGEVSVVEQDTRPPPFLSAPRISEKTPFLKKTRPINPESQDLKHSEKV